MDDIIAATERRVARECDVHGIVPEYTEREIVYQRGQCSGYVLRCFFQHQFGAALAFGESIIQALSGFGSILRRLSHDDQADETVVEISFKF